MAKITLYGTIIVTFYRRIFYIRQKILGPGAEECATTTTNISLVLVTLTPAADESPFEKAVRECPSRKGNAIYRLGRKAADCKEFAKAVHCYHIALVKQRSYYGKNHLKTAETLNFLGLALIELGELYGAIVAFEESLYIRQKILGPGAEECATTTTNISLVLDAQKRSLNS